MDTPVIREIKKIATYVKVIRKQYYIACFGFVYASFPIIYCFLAYAYRVGKLLLGKSALYSQILDYFTNSHIFSIEEKFLTRPDKEENFLYN